MPILRSSRLWCWLSHWSLRSWFAVCWRLGAGRLECFTLQPGHYSSLTAPNLQHAANQERNDQCGNQHHTRELLMMGIVMPETCWAYKKYNKIKSQFEVCRLWLQGEQSIHLFIPAPSPHPPRPSTHKPSCYKCSKYNHRAQECQEDVVSPHCAQSHKMHECRAGTESLRCVNCITYNKYSKTTQVNVNHSSLDKSCSCYRAVLKKYIERTDYWNG